MRVLDSKDTNPARHAKDLRLRIANHRAHERRLEQHVTRYRQLLASAEDAGGARNYNAARDFKEALRQLEHGIGRWDMYLPDLEADLYGKPALKQTRDELEKLRAELKDCEARIRLPYRVKEPVMDGETLREAGDVMLITAAQAAEFADYFEGPLKELPTTV